MKINGYVLLLEQRVQIESAAVRSLSHRWGISRTKTDTNRQIWPLLLINGRPGFVVRPRDHRVVTYRPEEQMKLYYMGNWGMCSDILCNWGYLPSGLWRDNMIFSFDRLWAITELNHRPGVQQNYHYQAKGATISSIRNHKKWEIIFTETGRVTMREGPSRTVIFFFDTW